MAAEMDPLFLRVLRTVWAVMRNTFPVTTEDHQVKVYTIDQSSAPSIVVGVTVMRRPLALVSRYLFDTTRRTEWEEHLEVARALETFNEHATTQYCSYSTRWPLAQRDMYTVSARMHMADGAHLIASKSVRKADEAAEAPVRGRIRASLLLGGFHLTPLDQGKACQVISVSQVHTPSRELTVINIISISIISRELNH
jgi:hypothetical protein